MKQIGRKGSTFGTVVAAALVIAVAGSGGAVAGGLVTSARIKNNTIKSIDVRNGTLTAADMAPGTIPAFYGYSTFHSAGVGVSTTGETTVLTLAIPSAGSYVASAVSTGDNQSSGSDTLLSCRLVAETDSDPKSVYLQTNTANSASRLGLAFQIVHTFVGPGTVRLLCTAEDDLVTMNDSRITAVRVEHLTGTAG